MENLDRLTTSTLAKLYKVLEPLVEDFSLIDPVTETEREVLTDLLNEVYRAGEANAGNDFIEMVTTHPTYTINNYDEDGDPFENGIFIHFRDTTIKVGESIDDLDTLIANLGKCRAQINERKHKLDFDF